MKKTLSFVLILAFVLSMCTFSFAEGEEVTTLDGIANQVGDWEAVEGGYKANSSGMILLDQQMNAGVIEVTVTPGSTFGTEINIFFKASGFDTLTAENIAQQRSLTAGYQACLYGTQASPKNCIGYYNHYSNGWKGGPNVDGAPNGNDYTKFPYDTFLGGAAGFANASFVLRIEFGSAGSRILVDGVEVIKDVYNIDKQAATTNKDIKWPTGTQIAIMANDDTFTNFKFIPWNSSNAAIWTQADCNSITNVAGAQGYAYNGNVVAPEGSTISFDVTAASFKEGTGNNGFFFGGDNLYGGKTAEKAAAKGRGLNYWMVYFNNSNTAQVMAINGDWAGRIELGVINFSEIIPENPGESITINVQAKYVGRKATITFTCGDKSVTKDFTIAEGTKRADGGDAIVPTGDELAFRVWNGSAMTFSNIKVDGKAINEHDTLGANGACSVCGYVPPKTGDFTVVAVAIVSFAVLAAGAVLTISKKRIAE